MNRVGAGQCLVEDIRVVVLSHDHLHFGADGWSRRAEPLFTGWQGSGGYETSLESVHEPATLSAVRERVAAVQQSNHRFVGTIDDWKLDWWIGRLEEANRAALRDAVHAHSMPGWMLTDLHD